MVFLLLLLPLLMTQGGDAKGSDDGATDWW